MKLRKIELKNFRQFYGEQSLTFSTDKNKNITLIHAENGTGKTAFLNAILWCFYEVTTQNFKDPTSMLNKVAKSEDSSSSYGVKIEFEDDNGRIFLAQRAVSGTNKSFKIFELEDHLYTEIDNPNSFINSVIPKDMSKYFFFQGEGIGKISGAKGDSIVRKAIREILGFTIAEKALQDVRSIRKAYQTSMSNADTSGKVSDLQKRISQIEDKIFASKDTIKECEQTISFYEEKILDIDQKLKSCDSAVIKQVHALRLDKEQQLQREKQLQKQAKEEKSTLISDFATTVFGLRLSQTALDFIDESEYKGTIPAPYNEQLVNDILKEAICICGAEIRPGSEAFSKINEMLKQASDPMLESRIRKARSQLTSIQQNAAKSKKMFLANIQSLALCDENIVRLAKELEELSIQIQGSEKLDDIKSLELERARAHNNLRQEEQTLGRAKANLERDEKDLPSLKNEISRLDSFSSEMLKFRELATYAEKVEEVIEQTLSNAEKDVELRIIEKVNKYLKLFVRQDYKAKLNPTTFDIRLVDNNDVVVAESDGQSLLLSLTFISSLIELSRERKKASGQILTPGAIAPFVVDAPFGDLDNKYKGHVASAIPDSVEQVVFLLSSSHWEGKVEENIRSKIGREYNMVLEEPSVADIKEADQIVIQGNIFDTVRYGQTIERTVIEEVGDYVS